MGELPTLTPASLVPIDREQAPHLEHTTESALLAERIIGLLGSKDYVARPGRMFSGMGDGGTAAFMTFTTDILKKGIRGSGRRIIGAQRVIRLCNQSMATVDMGFLGTGISLKRDHQMDVAMLGPSAFDAVPVRKRRFDEIPQELAGFIISRGQQASLPSSVVRMLEESSLPGYRNHDDLIYSQNPIDLREQL